MYYLKQHILTIHPGRYHEYIKDKNLQQQLQNKETLYESENEEQNNILIEMTGTIDGVIASKAMALADDEVGSWVLITSSDVDLLNESLTDYLKNGDKLA